MKIEMISADPVQEAVALSRMDKRSFPDTPGDWWDPEDWQLYDEVRWIKANGKKIGCVALGGDMCFTTSGRDRDWVRQGCVYLATTSILPGYRTDDVSNFVRSWQVEWTIQHGYRMISTNCRQSDVWYLKLSLDHDFKIIGVKPYFEGPKEPTIILERKLR